MAKFPSISIPTLFKNKFIDGLTTEYPFEFSEFSKIHPSMATEFYMVLNPKILNLIHSRSNFNNITHLFGDFC